MPPRDQALTRLEVLAKVYGQLTTRSHVFGVWATVGFFEVVDETVMPVKLGREMSWPANGIIRHRMFALVDRSQLQVCRWHACWRRCRRPAGERRPWSTRRVGRSPR
jgi:hypothetical protein